MSIHHAAPAPWPDRTLAVFRVVAAVIFISAGTTKLFGFPANPLPDAPEIAPFSQMWIGAWLEVVGGALIALGLLTRPAAFVLAGEMAVAYFQFHAPVSVFPTVNGGIPAILYCFLFLHLTAAGPGAWSVDAALARARRHRRHAGGRRSVLSVDDRHLAAGGLDRPARAAPRDRRTA